MPDAGEGGPDRDDGGSAAAPRGDGGWTDRHLWQIQPVRDVAAIVLLLWIVYLGSLASVVTVPLLLAILLAYLFEPVTLRLTRWRRVNRAGAVRLIMVAAAVLVFVPAFLGAGAGIAQGYELAGSISRRAAVVRQSVAEPEDERLRERVPEGAWRMLRDRIVEVQAELRAVDGPGAASASEGPEADDARGSVGEDRNAADRPGEARAADGSLEVVILRWIEQNASAVASGVARTGAGAFGAVVGFFGSLAALGFGAFLTAFFFYFIATGWPGVVGTMRGVIPDKREARIGELLGKMDRVVSGFVRGRLTIAAILAVFFVISYALVGVPAPVLVGGALGALSLVPYASLLGIPVTITLLWLEGHTGVRGSVAWVVIAPLAVYGVGQVLDDYVLTPAIQGDATDLDIPTVLFATLAGGALFGFYGLLIAIPLAACLKILLVEVAWPRVRAWASGEEKDVLPISR